MILLLEGIKTSPENFFLREKDSRSILYSPVEEEQVNINSMTLYRMTDLLSGNRVTLTSRELLNLIRENVLL